MRPSSTSSGALRRRDGDDAFGAYVCWREECIAVDRAYSAWTGEALDAVPTFLTRADDSSSLVGRTEDAIAA